MVTPAIVPPVAATDAAEKHVYKYQPTYPEGHELAGQAMGGEQAIEYDGTPEDLGAKMALNNNRLQAEVRNWKRQVVVRQTETDEDGIPQNAPRRSLVAAAIKPRDLTPEERMRISRGMADPEKVQESLDLAISARFGVSPDRLAQLDRGIQQTRDWIEGNKFRQKHQGVVDVPGNIKALLEWCDAKDLDYTCENLEVALKRLKASGLVLEAPIAAQEDPAKSQPEANSGPPADSGEPAAQPQRRQAATSSTILSMRPTGTPPVVRGVPTWADIESLTVEQLRAKPKEWKDQATRMFRKLPNVELNRKLAIRTMQAKLEALA